MIERIYVDFNSRVDENRILIPLVTVAADGARFHGGDLVILYDEELEVQARLECLPHDKLWVGVTDWSTKRFIS